MFGSLSDPPAKSSSRASPRVDATIDSHHSTTYELDDRKISKMNSSSPCKPIVVAAMEDDDNRFEALFDSQKNNDRSGKFSLTRYSTYTRN